MRKIPVTLLFLLGRLDSPRLSPCAMRKFMTIAVGPGAKHQIAVTMNQACMYNARKRRAEGY